MLGLSSYCPTSRSSSGCSGKNLQKSVQKINRLFRHQRLLLPICLKRNDTNPFPDTISEIGAAPGQLTANEATALMLGVELSGVTAARCCPHVSFGGVLKAKVSISHTDDCATVRYFLSCINRYIHWFCPLWLFQTCFFTLCLRAQLVLTQKALHFIRFKSALCICEKLNAIFKADNAQSPVGKEVVFALNLGGLCQTRLA